MTHICKCLQLCHRDPKMCCLAGLGTGSGKQDANAVSECCMSVSTVSMHDLQWQRGEM